MDFNGGRAISLAVTTAACLLSAEPASAFIAPAVATSTRASTAAASTPTMVSASPSKTFVTTKSEETFEEAKVRWGRWWRCRPLGVHAMPRKADGISSKANMNIFACLWTRGCMRLSGGVCAPTRFGLAYPSAWPDLRRTYAVHTTCVMPSLLRVVFATLGFLYLPKHTSGLDATRSCEVKVLFAPPVSPTLIAYRLPPTPL